VFLLQCVVVGDVSDVSDVHSDFICKVEVCRFMSFCAYIERSVLKWSKGMGIEWK
jgi:hypothetical protein